MIVARHKVGLGIHLDHRTFFWRDEHADQPFGGNATGFLGGLGQTLLAQPVDRGLHVAIGLGERGLAIHHARAGLVAQVLHHRGGDICHLTIPYRSPWPGSPRPSTSCFSNRRKTWMPGTRPGMTQNYSATNSFALAIQLWMRPGSPTSSPIFSASAWLSSASCE